jgi:hypothetical protein
VPSGKNEVSPVADEHQVPPPADKSEDRIKERDYSSDFSRMPEHETHPVTQHGSGPSGPVETTNGPIILMGIGAVVALLVFVFRSPWVLGLGIAIFVAAAIWAGVTNRGPGTMGGSGPSTLDPDEH